MADKKISQLTNLTGANLADNDEFVLVDTSADETKAITWSELKEGLDTGTGFVRITGDTMTGALDVQSTITADGLTVDGSLGDFSVSSGGNQASFTYNGFNYINATGDGAALLFRMTSANRSALKLNSNGDISFYEDTGTTPKFFWDASAESLGIGTSSPSQPLHVSGNIRVGTTSDTVFSNNFGSISSSADLAFLSNSNTVFKNTSGTERMRITNTGNVGIGTSSPASKLSVSGGASGVATDIDYSGGIVTGTEYSALRFTASGLGFVPAEIRGVNTNGGQNLGVMQMFTSGSERMRIDSFGRLGIGTSSPSAPLEVASSGSTTVTIRAGTDTSGSYLFFGDQSDTNAGYILYDHASDYMALRAGGAGEAMRIDSSGNLLVGTTTTSGASAPVVADGGIAIVDSGGRGVSQEIVKGASGNFTTITVSFDGTSGSGSLIVEILMTGFSGKYLDYAAGIYGVQADVVMRDNSDAATSVALSGTAGSSWTATITTSVSHPVVKVKATAGGLASSFTNAPTITFA